MGSHWTPVSTTWQWIRVVSLSPFYSNGERRKRTSSVCSNDSVNAGGIAVTPRRISWRQRIFLRVASPMKKSPSAMQNQGLCTPREPTVGTDCTSVNYRSFHFLFQQGYYWILIHDSLCLVGCDQGFVSGKRGWNSQGGNEGETHWNKSFSPWFHEVILELGSTMFPLKKSPECKY